MAQEKIAIARPYTEAVLGRAQETDSLDLWSDMLGLLSALVKSPELMALIDSPKLSNDQVLDALIDIGGENLNQECHNFLKILMHNRRVLLMPDIADLYERRKRECQGGLQVQVLSAYPLDEAQEQALATALQERLQRDIEIKSEQDPDLIGGILIHAGDLLIDGSVRGHLRRLANQLRY